MSSSYSSGSTQVSGTVQTSVTTVNNVVDVDNLKNNLSVVRWSSSSTTIQVPAGKKWIVLALFTVTTSATFSWLNSAGSTLCTIGKVGVPFSGPVVLSNQEKIAPTVGLDGYVQYMEVTA